MIEPVSLLAGFITIWAQFHNYGIDVENNPHLKDIRVRRALDSQLYKPQNRIHYPKTNDLTDDSLIMKAVFNGKERNSINKIDSQLYEQENRIHYPKTNDLKEDSVIMKAVFSGKEQNSINKIDSQLYRPQNKIHYPKTNDMKDDSVIMGAIYNGKEQNRAKRSYRSNYNGNNNENSYRYVEGKVPLANYSPNSPYYSQNTDGVTYYYTVYNGKNQAQNRYPDSDNDANNVIPLNRSHYQNNNQNSSKYVMDALSNGKNRYQTNFPQQPTQRQYYNHFTAKPINNQNRLNNVTVTGNNGYAFNNTVNGNNNTMNVSTAHFISGVSCPEFMRSVTLFGTKMCVDEDY